MTNEHNINVGDKVFYIGDKDLTAKQLIIKGTQGVVTCKGMSTDELCVNFGTICHVCADDLEAMHTDRRTAFLTELQSLLKKYDAEICYREGDCELHIDLGNGNTFDRISYLFEYPDYDINDVGRLNLTADNIMDFDKE